MRAGTIIGLGLHTAYLVALMLEPFMPDTAADILKQLQVPLR